jgi:hypothetical protein
MMPPLFDTHTPERETVTLLNTADVPVDLTGWSLKDKQKNASWRACSFV